MKVLIILFTVSILTVLLFLLYLLYNKYTYNTYDKYKEKYNKGNKQNIKILNLVLYSKGKEYDKMYNITRNYYSRFYPQVKTIYYMFDEQVKEPIIMKDILLIPGKETYIPGILDKTLKAIEFVKGIKELDYDYLLRSNISTVVNIRMLLNYLSSNPGVDYGGSWKMTHLRKGFRDPGNGITNDRYDGLDFISGTGIILSKRAVDNLLKNKDKIDYSVIDDVSIGQFFRQNTNIKPLSFNLTVVYEENKEENTKNKDIRENIFIRNRSSDREKDVKNMEFIISLL